MSGRPPGFGRGGGKGKGKANKGGGSSQASGSGSGQNLPIRPAGQAQGAASANVPATTPAVPAVSAPTYAASSETFVPSYSATRDDAIIKSENTLLGKLQQDGTPSLPLRPGYGTLGQSALLWTNYFGLTVDPNTVLHKYVVSVDKIDGKDVAPKKLIRILQLLVEQLSAGYGVATDSAATLISNGDIDIPAGGFLVPWRTETESVADSGAVRYVVHLKRPDKGATLSLQTLLDYTTSANASVLLSLEQEFFQALNIIIGQQPKSASNVISAGRNQYVDLNGISQNIGGGLKAMRAFVFSVRAATERLLINVQLKSFPFIQDGPLQHLAKEFMASNRVRLYALAPYLKRLSVEVTHLNTTNEAGEKVIRLRSIIGMANPRDGQALANRPRVSEYGAGSKDVQFFLAGDDDPLPSSSTSGSKKQAFNKAKATGRWISVYDFFRETYNITIANPDLPVVNVGSIGQPVYLPMEVCLVRAGQMPPARLTPEQTMAMISFAVRKPGENAKSIATDGLGLLGLQGSNRSLDAFGLTVDAKMLTVPSRVLPAPEIAYRSGRIRPSGGSWSLTDTKLLVGKTLQRWVSLLIVVDGRRLVFESSADYLACMTAFKDNLTAAGIAVSPRSGGLRVDIQEGDPEQKIDDALREFADRSPRPEMVLVVIPSTDPTLYNRVKQLCDVKLGMLCQCVLDSKLHKSVTKSAQKERPDLSYFANLALKVNLKLGGENHRLVDPNLDTITTTTATISTTDTMFVGIDVTHPSPSSVRGAPSVAAVVSSIDTNLAQWPAEIRVQEGRREMVAPLEEMFTACLKRWYEVHNKSYPRNIIVYRDGVSEGQYEIVLDEELPKLKSAAKVLYPPAESEKGFPKVSIIIVGKRHHTRFYGTDSRNPNNGTVVDRCITGPGQWDFFLQAHTAIKGTAKPAHYYVIYDEIFRKPKVEKKDPRKIMTPAEQKAAKLKAAKGPISVAPEAADKLEQLSHKLCYLFGRATKAVSVCPPAYYADLACERARCYLSKHFAPSPPGTSAASVIGGEQGAELPWSQKMITVDDNVKETMFYI